MKADGECSQRLESGKAVLAGDQGIEGLYGLARKETETVYTGR